MDEHRLRGPWGPHLLHREYGLRGPLSSRPGSPSLRTGGSGLRSRRTLTESPGHPPSVPRYLDVLDAVVSEAVETQWAVGEAVTSVGQSVEQPGDGGVLAARVEPQGAVGLREQPRVVLPAALRGPGRLLVLVQRAQRRVRIPQVRVTGLLALRVGQRRLRVRRGEVGRLEVGGGRVAERRSRAVGCLVERGQLRQAGPGRRPGQTLGAVLRRRRQRR